MEKLKGGIIALALFMLMGGAVWGIFERSSRIILTTEQERMVKKTLLTEWGDVKDQQILKMIGYNIRQIEVCRNCQEFKEWSYSGSHISYPVVGHRVQRDGVSYTLVVGKVGWYMEDSMDNMNVEVMGVIYIDHGVGGMFRIENNQMMYYDKSGCRTWSRATYLSDDNLLEMKRRAIFALHQSIFQRI